MMNELLRDLINTRKVESFIDNIMVGTEIEERQNKLVEEILKRLEENDLYIKLEKYRQKVKKVDFLRVVIGPEGIKMEDLDRKIRMEVNVSDYAIGGVLSMEYNNGKQRLVVYFSKSLNKTERNYKIHDKKMLVVIRGLENWRHLLEDAKFKFEI